MALRETEIAAVVAEVGPVLTGGWIQKIHQPSAQTTVLEIRVPGRTHRLLICCQPETARLHLLSVPLPNPPAPPPFCQYLRAHVQGARIDRIEQVAGDRIVRLCLTTKEGSRTVVAELIGRNATLLLIDEAGHIAADLTGKRVGLEYQPPKSHASGKVPLQKSEPAPGGSLYSVSAEIEARYQEHEAAAALTVERHARATGLKKAIKKLQRRIDSWEADLAKAEKYRDYARYGELIKANLAQIRKGQTGIEVVDYFDESLPVLTLPLDPAKTAQANMEDYFRRHPKYLTARRELIPRIERERQQLDSMRDELTSIQQGLWTPPAATAPGVPQSARQSREPSTRDERRGPYRRFISTDGLPIYVGRNARENDGLTFKLAKSDDLWLHARGTPGSHVVVRLEKGADVPPETLLDAATLALLYSDLRKSEKGDVVYTRRKWVKKAKGQAPGAVTIMQEKSLFVKLDRSRLESLKTRSSA